MLLVLVASSLIILFMYVQVISIRNKTQLQKAFIFLFSLMLLQHGSFFLAMNKSLEKLAFIIGYLAIILIPLCGLYIGLIYARFKLRFGWKYFLTGFPPLLSVILLITNDIHHLFFEIPSIYHSGLQYGIYFYFHALVSYCYIFIGIAYIIVFSIKSYNGYSKQAFLLSFGFFTSVVINIMITFTKFFTKQTDDYFCLVSFTLTVVFVWLAIIKYDFLKIIPISNRLIGDHISDGFLIMDENFYIVDYNIAFEAIFEKITVVQRKSIMDFAEKLKLFSDFDLMSQIRMASAKSDCSICEMCVDGNSGKQYLQLEITPVYKMESFLGWVLLFKDISWLRNSIQSIERNQWLLIHQKRRVFIGQLRDGIIHNLKSPVMSLAGGLESLKELIDEYRELVKEVSATTEDHLEVAREMNLWVEKMKPCCSAIADIVSAVKGQISPPADKTFFSLDSLWTRLKLLLRYEMKRNNIFLNIHCPFHETCLFGSCDDLVQVLSIVITNVIKGYDGAGVNIRLSVTVEDEWILFSVQTSQKGVDVEHRMSSLNDFFKIQGPDKSDFNLFMAQSIIQDSFRGHVRIDIQERERKAFFIAIPRGV